MEDTSLFLQQYGDHIQIPGFGVPGQEALNNARVLVNGAGALASPLLTYLCSMGIGHLGIISDQKIRRGELPSEPVFRGGDEGKLKTQILASRLREVNPDVRIRLHEQAPDRESVLDLIAGYDLVVDVAQVPERSLLINDACVIVGKPLIYGVLDFPSGSYSVLNYKGGATLRCLIKDKDAGPLIQRSAKIGLATLPALISCMIANEAVKVIAEIGQISSGKLVTFNVFSNQLSTLRVEPVEEYRNLTSLQSIYLAAETEQRSEPSRIRSISPKLLDIKIRYKEPLQLVDLRDTPIGSPDESWNYLHIPERQFADKLDDIHQDIIVVLLSEDGERAAQLAVEMNERQGFDNIYYLEGGIRAWNSATGTPNVEYESF
ncbi:MAG: ThiF family adenylyltransferase [Arcticibacter sp.]